MVVALAVCGWFEAAMAPFGVESSAVTFSAAAVVLASATALVRRKDAASLDAQRPSGEARRRMFARDNATAVGARADVSLRRQGLLAWSSAGLLALAVEMWELAQKPRHLHPTLSSLANEVLGPGHRVVRALAFALWGAAGFALASPPKSRA